MNHTSRTSLALLALASIVFNSSAQADDKNKDYAKKLYQWQQQQQQALQQWKLQEVQKQQQLLQQKKTAQRSRTILVPGTPWGASQNGRGSMTFSGNAADRLNFAVVTLNNFYDSRGNTKNSGSATVTLYGNYSYPFRGSWSMQGNLTVGLSLTPAANVVRGDKATGNLTMTPPNGANVSRITLTGVMSGSPFTASFSSP